VAPLKDVLPDPDALLALEPEELAGYVLEYLNALPPDSSELNRHNFHLPHTVQGYPQGRQKEILGALMEAWVWLEREGLLIPTQDQWRAISRRGRRLTTRSDVETFRKTNMLPLSLLHPSIATKVWAEFLRGDYDTAVFQAFKEVEVAVRSRGGFADTDLGTDLMRKAFHPETGRLTDGEAVAGERQARSDLFAGAIGSYKNPSSHRAVVMDSEEAVELIMLASHLLHVVDMGSGRSVR
jgi:uncharacterized protein (TIGR02391 family)